MREPSTERDAPTARPFSLFGRAALALFALHVILLFFPPIPPDVKGSLWSYVLAYLAVLLMLTEMARAGPGLAARWVSVPATRRWTLGLGAAMGSLALASALRVGATPLYMRFSGEEGVWEPLSLFCYAGGAAALFAVAGGLARRERKHCRFVAALYTLLALEEIDYFGVVGGILGRVDGVYVGSLHDLVVLLAEGLLTPTALAVIAGVALLAAGTLWVAGYVQPRALFEMVTSVEFLWASIGLGFLFAAAAVEAGVLGLAVSEPTLEEPIELAGTICLFVYAFQLAGRQARAEGVIRAAT